MKKNICFVSCLLPQSVQDELARDFHVIPLTSDPRLPSSVASHPDMILSVIGENLILPRSYYEENCDLFDSVREIGYSIVLSDAPRSQVYPADVGLNVAVGKDFIICRTDSTATEVLDAAKESGMDIINVKQGYAGCSCIVTDSAVLTSDIGIHRALAEHGIDSTYVDKSGISLPGYDVGFIGGCGGFYDGVLYFFGSIDSVECGKVIREFAALHGYEIREPGREKLTDYGGMKIFGLPLDKPHKK